MSTRAYVGHFVRLALMALGLGCDNEGAASNASDAGLDADTHTHTHTHAHDAAPELDASSEADAASDAAQPSSAYEWALPKGFPVPVVPADNPVTAAKVELGRHLFYEERLSGNGTQSCASCHEQARAFTDGRALAVGSTGEAHPRSSMSLVNVAYASSFTWANAALSSLETQALVPLTGENPIELGLAGKLAETLDVLREDAGYLELFERAFPGDAEPVSIKTIVDAVASFQRVLISGDSPYDRYLAGERQALSPAAQRGKELFFSEKLECFHCHGGFNLSGAVTYVGKAFDETTFHNNGLYNLDGNGAYPADNTGLHAFTGRAQDMGRFKAPTLRNIAKTAPYMHDGTIATLSEVLDHYAAGGRNVVDGPNSGDGRVSPVKSDLLPGFELSAAEKADVLAFLESLTDEAFLNDPRYADPALDDEAAR